LVEIFLVKAFTRLDIVGVVGRPLPSMYKVNTAKTSGMAQKAGIETRRACKVAYTTSALPCLRVATLL